MAHNPRSNPFGELLNERAELKQENVQKENERVIYSERSSGMVSRSFSLPGEVDEQRARAESIS